MVNNEKYLKAEKYVLDYFKDSNFHIEESKTIYTSKKTVKEGHTRPGEYKNRKVFDGTYGVKTPDGYELTSFRIKSNWLFPRKLKTSQRSTMFYIITDNKDNPDKFKVVPFSTINRCIKWAIRKEKTINIDWKEFDNKQYKNIVNITNFMYLKDFKSILFKYILIDKKESNVSLYSKFPMAIENQKRPQNDKMIFNGVKFVKYSEYVSTI